MNTIEQPQTAGEENFITRVEVAELLGINLVSLWRYTRQGLLPYYRIGRKMYFRKSEIIASMKVKGVKS
jgi:excisionase family DNA binding protein